MRCRGSQFLCGLSYCPILVEALARARLSSPRLSQGVEGSSPPSVFVGREGYPRVRVYPASPPDRGDTSWYEEPSAWMRMDLEEFLSARLSMVRGYRIFRVDEASRGSRVLEDLTVLGLSPRPVEVEIRFSGRLDPRPLLSDHVPPMGPSAPAERITLASVPPPERIVERLYSDRDVRAGEAVRILYQGGIGVHRISRILSLGALGRSRRLVPTRWAITAVDKILSDHLLKIVKEYKVLDRYMVFSRRVEGNLFLAILAPARWAFEWGEAWYPGSTWNPWGRDPWVEVDYEGYTGRDSYPGIGGCYYASRLAVLEALSSMKRQAAPILWREIYEGFNLPVGVWFVRENVRAMMRGKAEAFDTLEKALARAAQLLRTPVRLFLERSGVVRILRSRKITSYAGRGP